MARDFVNRGLPFIELHAHICLKPTEGDDRGRLRNVNADPRIPNEDAAITPYRVVAAG
jgi:hypothetical protein